MSLTTQVKHQPISPSADHPVKLEVTFCVQGVVSPLLANIYLHYVFDLWVHQWRRRHAHGEVIVVRFADDFVMGFEHKDEAERFLTDLRDRFARFGLALHPDKTRVLEFGRFAAAGRQARGAGKPETFNFLGFTHICAKTRKGRFTVLRQTIRKRLQAKLQSVHDALRRRLHDPIPEQGKYLRAVLAGHLRYYGVPMNAPALAAFRGGLLRLWTRALRRRSQRSRVTVERMRRYATRWLPAVRTCHPYPTVRFGVTP
jgi:RNA-directed DNA polymerase